METEIVAYSDASVRGQVPQKQGLKRDPGDFLPCPLNVRGQVPQKQGLKHNV